MTSSSRSYNMSCIKGKDTKPEQLVRSFLFSKGLRFRKNDKRYPGHPDVVLPKYHAVVFVNGCFWHGHDGCPHYSHPKTNEVFWKEKILRNKERDWLQYQQLIDMGWRVLVVWECELKKDKREERLMDLYQDIVNYSTQNIASMINDDLTYEE